ncbi:hypothetical protein WEI85_33240 [Actinomycetes bacterium KLBMP 9797]
MQCFGQVAQHGPQPGWAGDGAGQVAEVAADPCELGVDAFGGASA